MKKERISTALSSFTRTQNIELANKETKLFKPNINFSLEQDQYIKRRTNDNFTNTRQGLRMAQFKIKQVLDTGDLHHIVHPNAVTKVLMQ